MKTRVLVIDDDKILTDMLKISLEPDTFEVIAANTGEEGLKAARQKAPELVILDLVMPGLTGWQVGKEIRAFSNVPILVFSALDKPEIVSSALDDGADDFLIKPVSIEVLVAHVNKLLRRARAEYQATPPNTNPTSSNPNTQSLSLGS